MDRLARHSESLEQIREICVLRHILILCLVHPSTVFQRPQAAPYPLFHYPGVPTLFPSLARLEERTISLPYCLPVLVAGRVPLEVTPIINERMQASERFLSGFISQASQG